MTDNRIAFIGSKTVTPSEEEELMRFGDLLARINAVLHTSQLEGANQAVLRGYRARGAKPVFHTSGLHTAAPWIVAYGDDDFIASVTGTRGFNESQETTTWDLLRSKESLAMFNKAISKALATWREGTTA